MSSVKEHIVKEYIDTDFRIALDQILEKEQIRSVLLFTGRTSYDRLPARMYFDALAARITVTRYSGFGTNPSYDELVAAIDRLQGAKADMVIAIGGGSVIDFAKLMAIYLDNRDALENGFPDMTGLSVTAPIVAIPTTSGSGSEATHFAVMYRGGSKYSLVSPQMQPAWVIIDPELVSTMPPDQTAASGIDALCQAMESLWARNATDESRELARHAITLILPHIEQACRQPGHRSRRAMALGAFYAGKAINISKTTGLHAMSYYLTDHKGIPHGEAVAMNMEIFIELNLPAIPEVIRQDYFSLFNVQDIQELTRSISDLKKNLGLRMDILEAGITSREELEAYLASVNEERMANNPKKISNKELLDVYWSRIQNTR